MLRRMPKRSSGVSRRSVLKGAGLAGAALAVPLTPAPVDAQAPPPRGADAPSHLTADAFVLLEAICARLIPSDANGPGAREARAAHYIDRALGGFLADQLGAYRDGLSAFDRYSRSSRGDTFTRLSERDQDSLLIDVETGSATGFPASSAQFFAMVRTHTLQGTFGDPFYGGNANFVGWDMLGYPGIRLNVTAADQALGTKPAPTHKSAYDNAMFTKAEASGPRPQAPGLRSQASGPGPQAPGTSVPSAALEKGSSHGD